MNNHNQLTELEEELLEAAFTSAQNSYSPYSGYHVGAAVRTESGEIYTGTVVENASFGMTVCAEVSAITAAVTNGDPDITNIAVVGGFPDDEDTTPPTPCGRCRQVIHEMSSGAMGSISVICSDLDLTTLDIFTLEDLFPHPFGRSNLNT